MALTLVPAGSNRIVPVSVDEPNVVTEAGLKNRPPASVSVVPVAAVTEATELSKNVMLLFSARVCDACRVPPFMTMSPVDSARLLLMLSTPSLMVVPPT